MVTAFLLLLLWFQNILKIKPMLSSSSFAKKYVYSAAIIICQHIKSHDPMLTMFTKDGFNGKQ